MDQMSTCPFCHLSVPSSELERHANSHFEDEQLERDIDLAKQISLASSISPLHAVETGMASGNNYWNISSRCGSSSGGGRIDIDEKIGYLLSLQIKENFYNVNDGLMALLRNCLELDSNNSTSILSGYVDHFQSIESEDVGWGCGWRNIQMLSSHLLKQRQEAREVLFGRSGFVPDIASLQRWLEVSWEKGFDALGSNDFDSEIYGKRNWIGTTECAALFRSFGIRARIVDFSSKEMSISSTPGYNHGGGRAEVSAGKRMATQVYGPMDKFVSRGDCSTPPVGSSGYGKLNDSSTHLGKVKGHQILIDWVWNYFSDNKSVEFNKHQVIVSEKPGSITEQALVLSARWPFKNNCWNSSQISVEGDAAIYPFNFGPWS